MSAKEATDLLQSLIDEAKSLTDGYVEGLPDFRGCRP
jgi:hypothetical protein